MKILALDPSSACTGYAVMTGLRAEELLDLGTLKPWRRDDEPIERIRAMVVDAVHLVREHAVEAIVIEETSGKVARRHGGSGAGLAVYGMAVGAIWGALAWHRHGRRSEVPVHTVRENVWTQRKSKARRLAVLARIYPQYQAAAQFDPGGDAGDAIGIGRWWLEERTLTTAAAAAGTEASA